MESAPQRMKVARYVDENLTSNRSGYRFSILCGDGNIEGEQIIIFGCGWRHIGLPRARCDRVALVQEEAVAEVSCGLRSVGSFRQVIHAQDTVAPAIDDVIH